MGALVGLVLTPFITTRPARAVRATLSKVSAQTLVAGLIGLIVGLAIATLLAFPISLLPDPFGRIFPFLGVLLFGYLGVIVFVMRQNDIFSVMRNRLPGRSGESESAERPGERGGRSLDPAGYQRHHRRAHCRYRPHRVPVRHFAHPAVCVERIAIYCRFG